MALLPALEEDEVGQEARQVYKKFKKEGEVPQWVKVMAHNPKITKEFTKEELIEIVSIIGLFNYINRFNNTLCIVPE